MVVWLVVVVVVDDVVVDVAVDEELETAIGVPVATTSVCASLSLDAMLITYLCAGTTNWTGWLLAPATTPIRIIPVYLNVTLA